MLVLGENHQGDLVVADERSSSHRCPRLARLDGASGWMGRGSLNGRKEGGKWVVGWEGVTLRAHITVGCLQL